VKYFNLLFSTVDQDYIHDKILSIALKWWQSSV
jgi:hypothetical protein